MSKNKLKPNEINALFKKDFVYLKIERDVLENCTNEDEITKLKFENTKFSKGGEFYFPYTSESAGVIVNYCNFFTNIKELLLTFHFQDSLNLHKSYFSLVNENADYELYEFRKFEIQGFENSDFTKSGLSQDEYFSNLKIANWSYENVVISATFFYLNSIHDTHLREKTIAVEGEQESKERTFNIEMTTTGYKIAQLFLNIIFGKKLFFTLQKTNIFSVYPKIWLNAFSLFIGEFGKSSRYNYESQNKKYFFNEIKKYEKLNFYYISFYLQAFNYMIPENLRKLIFSICFNTKTVHILYYALKKYSNIFDTKINFDRKKYNDYLLNNKISSQLLELEFELDIELETEFKIEKDTKEKL